MELREVAMLREPSAPSGGAPLIGILISVVIAAILYMLVMKTYMKSGPAGQPAAQSGPEVMQRAEDVADRANAVIKQQEKQAQEAGEEQR